MRIIVSVNDVWLHYGEHRSRFLANLGLKVEDLVRFAFGFMVLSYQPRITTAVAVGLDDIIGQVTRLLNDRLSDKGQSVYGRHHPTVHRIVDTIGEISHLMADSVTRQIGDIPPDLRLHHFTGPDIVLTTNED